MVAALGAATSEGWADGPVPGGAVRRHLHTLGTPTDRQLLAEGCKRVCRLRMTAQVVFPRGLRTTAEVDALQVVFPRG